MKTVTIPLNEYDDLKERYNYNSLMRRHNKAQKLLTEKYSQLKRIRKFSIFDFMKWRKSWNG